MNKIDNPSKEKVKELTVNETLLLTQIHSLQIKNITLELRLIRMEQHFDQLIKYTKFPASDLAWGPKALISKYNILIRD